ncbi:MAG: LEPR-XLL domain-containing protein, partial [Planctomycetota bacterium]
MREATLIETLEPRIILSASLEALDDVIVQSTVNPTGQVTALFRNVAGRPTLLQASDAATDWSASDLLAEVGLTSARADTTIFTDPRTGRTSIALISGETLYLAEQQADGSWVATDLTAAASAAESPLRSLTSFVSIGNPNLNTRADDRIHIAGVSLAGDMLLFRQQVDAEGFVVDGWE